MATQYVPYNNSLGVSLSDYVRVRGEVTPGDANEDWRSVAFKLVLWRTNQGYETYGTTTCRLQVRAFLDHSHTSYETVYDETRTVGPEIKVTYNSYTPFFEETIAIPFVATDVNTYGQGINVIFRIDSNNSNIGTEQIGYITTLGGPSAGKYTVSYKGSTNADYGFPEAQTAKIKTAVTLSTHKPARPGYTFTSWNTKKDGSGTAYAPGASFTSNTEGTVYLYAQWTINKYTVLYDANGGTGAPASQTKTHGVDLTLSSTVPTRQHHKFKGWGSSSIATTVLYAPGATYTANAGIELYAIWERTYTEPRITDLLVYRCDSAGKSKDDGTYFKIVCNWNTDAEASNVIVEWKSTNDTSWSSKNLNASGTSGSVNSVLGSGDISIDDSYWIIITVSDSEGSTSITKSVAGMVYTIDCLAGGKGISFGKPAETENLFEVEFPAKFNKGVEFVVPFDSAMMLAAYPVGSIYWSYNHISPATLFGGSWTRISPYFLYAAGETATIGETGLMNMDTGTSSAHFIKVAAWRRIE